MWKNGKYELWRKLKQPARGLLKTKAKLRQSKAACKCRPTLGCVSWNGKTDETEIGLNRLLIFRVGPFDCARLGPNYAISRWLRPWLIAGKRNAIFLNFLTASDHWLVDSPAVCTGTVNAIRNQRLTSKKQTETRKLSPWLKILIFDKPTERDTFSMIASEVLLTLRNFIQHSHTLMSSLGVITSPLVLFICGWFRYLGISVICEHW